MGDRETFRHSLLFAGVTRDVADPLLDRARLVDHAAGARLYKPGDPADRLFVVATGKVQVYRGDTHGKHIVLSVALSGAPVGLEDVMERGTYHCTAAAVGRGRTLQIAAADFVAAAESDPALGSAVTQHLLHRLHGVTDQLARNHLRPTAERLAEYLLDLAPRTDPKEIIGTNGGLEFNLPYEKGLIAAYLGMEPESLSRALKELQPLGVDNKGKTVRIADPTLLREMCAAHPD